MRCIRWLLVPICGIVCLAADEDSPVLPANPDGQPSGVRLLMPSARLPGRAEKRLFGILPNYRAEDASATYKPLKTWEKFKIAERDTFDWPNYFVTAGFALQTQLAGGGWKAQGGARGFAEYYARSYGDQIIGNFLVEAAFPTAFHEDPRYFRKGQGSSWKRAAYAASRIFVTRNENGGNRVNCSELLGNLAVTAITSSYYPENRTLEGAGEHMVMALGNDMMTNLLTEFWPDIKRRLPFKRRVF